MMKISIITATYNSEKTITSCMLSVLRQSYPAFEYIIIDGKSTDKTLDTVERHQLEYPTIKFQIISEPDHGIYDALNKGIALATGDILGFVHSDDLLANYDIMRLIVKEFKEGNIDGVYGDLHYVQFENTEKIVRKWVSQPFNKRLLHQGWMPAHPTLFLKHEVYEKHGVFNLGYKIAADYDFMLRILKDDTLRFSYLPEVITKMRVGGMSNHSLKNILLKTREDYRAVRSNKVGGIFSILRKNTSKIKQFF